MTDGRIVKKILVPTDGSDTAIAAARYAADMAKCTNAEVTVMYAAEISGVTQFVTYAVQARQDIPKELRETGEVVLEKTRKPFLESGIRVHTKILEGSAAEMILKEAKEGDYDLIIMGSRGAGVGLVQRVMLGLGSTAERIVGNAPCPVLVVRKQS